MQRREFITLLGGAATGTGLPSQHVHIHGGSWRVSGLTADHEIEAW